MRFGFRDSKLSSDRPAVDFKYSHQISRRVADFLGLLGRTNIFSKALDIHEVVGLQVTVNNCKQHLHVVRNDRHARFGKTERLPSAAIGRQGVRHDRIDGQKELLRIALSENRKSTPHTQIQPRTEVYVRGRQETIHGGRDLQSILLPIRGRLEWESPGMTCFHERLARLEQDRRSEFVDSDIR